jgi:hypothetical protein
MKSRCAQLVQWEGWGPAIIEGHGCQLGLVVPNSHPQGDYNQTHSSPSSSPV